MKNRNDDKKYILSQYRKKQIKRLFNKLQEIQNRSPKTDRAIIKRMFGEEENKLVHIPKNHTEQRLYEIRKQNERLVEKLAVTKMTVVSHKQPSNGKKKSKTFRLRDTFRQQQIQTENKRLFRAIRRASSDLSVAWSMKKSGSSGRKFSRVF